MSSSVRSKFRGCMIGSLLGDCLGVPFEFDSSVSRSVLNNFFRNLLSGNSKQILSYSDDSAMAISIAKSLIDKHQVEPVDLAKRFVKKYFKEPNRGYGDHVVSVFSVLRDTEFRDVFLPASLQFGGSGSYGNGAAMRIAPLALFGEQKDDSFIQQAVDDISRITHTHPFGCNGAILQCYAVHTALKSAQNDVMNPVDFISTLQSKMEPIEKGEKVYAESLQKMKDIYMHAAKSHEDVTAEEIAECLGNSVSAQKSVPTAIYSFLRGLKPLKNFECDNPFVRTLHFAISVGGDTDTIACMAGAIAGAYHGFESIPDALQERCEYVDKMKVLADKLYDVSQNVSS